MKILQTPSPYTPEQVLKYLHSVKYFSSSAVSPAEGRDAKEIIDHIPRSVEALDKLIRCHLIAFPFENLSMHYTESRQVSISPQGAYDRMVSAGRGFGSYCFGHNTLFKGILQGLGYRVYAAASRVNIALPDDRGMPCLGPQQHLILIVQLPSQTPNEEDGQVYLVDVGFGGVFGVSGLVRSIPLKDGHTVPGSASPEEHRVIIARNALSALVPSSNSYRGPDIPKEWFLQVRMGPTEDRWRTLHHFSIEEEFFEPDVEFNSFAVSNILGHPLMMRLICIKVFAVDNGEAEGEGVINEQPLGRYSVSDKKMTKKIGNKSEVVATFETEWERVEALRKYCDVDLKAEDVQWMRGQKPALAMD